MDKRITGLRSIIDQYIQTVYYNYPDLEEAILFGSYARGGANENSDIDLALIFHDLLDAERFDRQVKLMLLATKIDSRIEPHPISQNDIQSFNPFIKEVSLYGIPVFSAT